jgi:predicted deacetylase
MTAKEKARELRDKMNLDLMKALSEQYNARFSDVEKIIDDYAIEFAEWLLIIYNQDIIYDAYSKEELLEIYKKEKQL